MRRICLALYLIEILHQTTTFGRHFPSNDSCILSKFYIKPQLTRIRPYSAIVVSYRNSTSNHNLARQQVVDEVLYLIEILHQTTTLKRGPFKAVGLYLIEILHQTTTKRVANSLDRALYLIEILHQTTTMGRIQVCHLRCILSKFYIKPQQYGIQTYGDTSCILSKFYIKPQHIRCQIADCPVVSYRNSTSNHNRLPFVCASPRVVSYRNSTSNHNAALACLDGDYVVSYRNSTSNHNDPCLVVVFDKLYLIEILHQTTTHAFVLVRKHRCILSKFYIKPQLVPLY